ncbi:MAG: BrnA antitoxin family protein, partial [Candidatus Binatia bacterium]|nr:BrnA antitoxin family protein [Candidatus Binatia bacterium]
MIPQVGKTRITIYLDDAILKRFKGQPTITEKGYQTLINDALTSY